MKYVARPKKFRRSDAHTIAHIYDSPLIKANSLALPDRVEIESEPGSDRHFMYRYTKTGEFCGDTWHEDLKAAFEQANFEYGLSAADFLVVHDSSHGSAA